MGGSLPDFCKAIELSGERTVAIAAGDFCALALLASGDFVAAGDLGDKEGRFEYPEDTSIWLHFVRSWQQPNKTDIVFLGWDGHLAHKCTLREAKAEITSRARARREFGGFIDYQCLPDDFLSEYWDDDHDDDDDDAAEGKPVFDSKENRQMKRWRDAQRRNWKKRNNRWHLRKQNGSRSTERKKERGCRKCQRQDYQ